MTRLARRLAAAASAVWALGCAAPDPRPLALGQDACDYCKMAISDARFGGEVVMKTGKIHTFDAVECLAAWVNAADASKIAGVYVVDLQHPGTLVPAESAGFLKGAMVPSPMGRAISAFASPAAAEQQRAVLSGAAATWKELLADHAAPPGGRS